MLKITPIEKSTPPEPEALAARLYSRLPRVHITDLLAEVASWTLFPDCFTHLRTDASAIDNRVLIAGLLADGLNLGLTRMAEACSVATLGQLAWTSDWHIREETYALAPQRLVNQQQREPFAAMFGSGGASSSDGQFFQAGGFGHDASRFNAHYGQKPGFKVYTHISDRYAPVYTKLIASTASEALHVLDALLYHRSDVSVLRHHTDGGGDSDHVFALCTLLGFGRFVSSGLLADHGAADRLHLRFEGWRAVFRGIGHHGRLAWRQFSRNLFNESGVGSLADEIGRFAENCAARSRDGRRKRTAEHPRQRADQSADSRTPVAFLRDLLHRQFSARIPYNDGRTEELDPLPSVHVPQSADCFRDLLLVGKDNRDKFASRPPVRFPRCPVATRLPASRCTPHPTCVQGLRFWRPMRRNQISCACPYGSRRRDQRLAVCHLGCRRPDCRHEKSGRQKASRCRRSRQPRGRAGKKVDGYGWLSRGVRGRGNGRCAVFRKTDDGARSRLDLPFSVRRLRSRRAHGPPATGICVDDN